MKNFLVAAGIWMIFLAIGICMDLVFNIETRAYYWSVGFIGGGIMMAVILKGE